MKISSWTWGNNMPSTQNLCKTKKEKKRKCTAKFSPFANKEKHFPCLVFLCFTRPLDGDINNRTPRHSSSTTTEDPGQVMLTHVCVKWQKAEAVWKGCSRFNKKENVRREFVNYSWITSHGKIWHTFDSIYLKAASGHFDFYFLFLFFTYCHNTVYKLNKLIVGGGNQPSTIVFLRNAQPEVCGCLETRFLNVLLTVE